MTGDLAELDKYITAFDECADESGFDNIALLYFFKRGLHPKLVDNISGTYPRPLTLADYKKRAVEVQNEYLSRRAERERWRRERPSTSAPRSSAPAAVVNVRNATGGQVN
ncbi:hypothetical protein V5O48_019570, partial [Marasmius crinis-equi]